MLRCTKRSLFHIPITPAGAAEARRVVGRGAAPSSARFRKSGSGLRNGTHDDADATAFSSGSAGEAPATRRAAGFRHSHRQPGRTLRPGEPLPPPPQNEGGVGGNGNGNGYTSQRRAYQRQKAERETAVDAAVAGSYFTPLPRSYGFYDGLDAHALDTPRPSRQERQEQLRAALESQAASVVEFTDGGEADIDMNGLPAEQYHGHAGWTTIPRDSALYNATYGASDLESRQRTNSWGAAMLRGSSGISDLLGASAVSAKTSRGGGDGHPSEAKDDHSRYHQHHVDTDDEAAEVLDDRRRRRQHDESLYSTALEGELLAPTQESVGQPRSTYALRKLFVDGLVGYQGMISRAEEAAVSEELLHLLQSPRAAYIAEEARYCVNLYEKELGIPGKDTLAFALSRCPSLQRILYRFFFLGLIPSVPNVCQVSEMVGTFSGYPVHRHPRSIGAYVGLLNLVSTSVLHLQHKDAPWYPRLHLSPRSLFVVTEPCLSEYAMGYKRTQQPFHTFEYATRVSKDYRIEVLFATVETAQAPTLSEAVQLTEYATAKMNGSDIRETNTGLLSSSIFPGVNTTGSRDAVADTAAHRHETSSSSPSALQGGTDEWLQQLRAKLHHTAGEAEDGTKPIDGHALRQQLLAQHVVGSKARDERRTDETDNADARRGCTQNGAAPNSSSPSPSAAQRRLAALKARFEFAQSLKAAQRQVEVPSSGPRLIRGHSPKDRHMGIK